VKALVIGYGNTLRRDDGVGPFVAQLLEPSAGLQVIACHQLTPELAEPVSQARLVVFVDARADLAPGQVAVQPIAPSESPLIHRFSAGALLAWSMKLYGRAPEAFLVGIGGESYELGEGLTPAAARAAGEALRMIRELLSHSPEQKR
jgi:hydrogenase maturation protease